MWLATEVAGDPGSYTKSMPRGRERLIERG
jgi:hypothetical protein